MAVESDEDARTAVRPGRAPDDPIAVVGLGASAGGVGVLQTLFDEMPPDSDLAFVVVMHLSPEHESSLDQVLRSRTSMPVTTVENSERLVRNHVYVIPPGKHLALGDGLLQAVDPQQPTGRRVAIDLFFRTLAAAYGSRAVAIVLSGIDSDGAIGVKHVKEQGGLTIAQDPDEAQFDSMPRSVIETGMIDWVLPVGQMPAKLVEFVENERRMHMPPENISGDPLDDADDVNSGGPLRIDQQPSMSDEAALVEVLRFLRSQTGHDFGHYKRATILRRLARRMQVNLVDNIGGYLSFLRTHTSEVTALLRDFLISVTNFFRDRAAFAALEAHIPQLFADKQSSDQIRVWTAGCATGEEAYSVAILLQEHAGKLDNPPAIQVFATDLDEEVIQIARNGSYQQTIEADVSTERLRRFFQKEHGRYRIKKEIRELVLFSAHNLLKDSPFSRLDLVTCRNLLIYLKREAQESVLDVFHFALRPGGLLFLGNSEGMTDSHAMFAALDKVHRIYVRKSIPRPRWQVPAFPRSAAPGVALRSSGLWRTSASAAPIPADAALHSDAGFAGKSGADGRGLLFGDLHLQLLERLAPPSVIVDETYNVVHLSENAGQFLRFAGGDVSTNVLKLVHPGMRIDLRTALLRAGKGEANVTVKGIPLDLNGERRHINLHVRPMRRDESPGGYSLIVFDVLEDGVQPEPRQDPPHAIYSDLEEENQHLKSQLDATVEQYEATVEELKASNEELQAINEEMRSATEELETSKEELQSINEELTTVNHELKSNVEELSRVNSDLQNLMASTEIGTVFLDRQLRIKRFTPSAQDIFNLIASDVGRPLTDITHKLNYDKISEDAVHVLRDLKTTEREVQSAGHWLLVRVLPYRTVDDHIDGVVLTFIDITDRKRSDEERMALERQAAAWRERNRVAHELHDTLAQAFTAIKLQLDAAEEALGATPDDSHTAILRARRIAEESLRETRLTLRSLRAQGMDTEGLAGALQAIVARNTSGGKPKVSFSLSGAPVALSSEVDDALFRIAQEALTNALRHAEAKRVTMRLAYSAEAVELTVTDDGKGFDGHASLSGQGVSGMRERAAQVGATLAIERARPRGTTVAAKLAVSQG
ncbi:MAG TPA: chemotaxis protein CheB [Chthonomonadaceae bacterium]|nr:chemotaxis protein CheB [Chthonomonadaceae bacterium]